MSISDNEEINLNDKWIADLLTYPIELRIPKASIEGRNQGTVSGYFDRSDRLRDAIEYWSGKAPAIYATLNPVKSDLLARSHNRWSAFAQYATVDPDITRRVWLPIDTDAVRPSGISATDAEHDAALDRIRSIAAWLEDHGCPRPIIADSGNGGHALYRIDAPNDVETSKTIQQFLELLASRFSDDTVKVDRTVYNAARVWKIYGTKVRKGDEVGDRRHRTAAILDCPDDLQCLSLERVRALVEVYTDPHAVADPDADKHRQSVEWLEEFLEKHSVATNHIKDDWQGRRVWRLVECPFCGERDKSAVAFVAPDGKMCYRCHHDRCKGIGWADFRSRCEDGQIDLAERATQATTYMPHADVEFEDDVSPDLISALIATDTTDLRYAYLWKGFHGRYLTDADRKRRIESIDEVWSMIPQTGLIPAYIKRCLPTTDAPPIFHLGGALVLAAHLLNRRCSLPMGGYDLLPNLYVLLTAESSTQHKSTALRPVKSLIGKDDDYSPTLLPNETTPEQFLATLGYSIIAEGKDKEQFNADREVAYYRMSCQDKELMGENVKGKGLWIVDEVGAWLGSMERSYSVGMKGIITEFWDCPHEHRRETKTQGITYIYRPCLSILGGTTLDWLSSNCRESDLGGGFLPRWLFLTSNRKDYILSLQDAPQDEDELAAYIVAAKSIHGRAFLSREAEDYYWYWREQLETSASAKMRPWVNRLGAYALKIALIYQATSQKSHELESISRENIEIATRLIQHVRQGLTDMLKYDLAFGENDKRYKRLMNVIREGRIQRSTLLQTVRPLTKRDVDPILETLVESGMVRSETDGKARYYAWTGD